MPNSSRKSEMRKRKSPQKAVGYRTVRQGKTPYHTLRTCLGADHRFHDWWQKHDMSRKRRDAKYCSVECRVAAYRKRQRAAHRGLTRGEVVTLRALVICLDSALTRLRRI